MTFSGDECQPEEQHRRHHSFNDAAGDERLRGLALGQKSWLFAGSERGAERAHGIVHA